MGVRPVAAKMLHAAAHREVAQQVLGQLARGPLLPSQISAVDCVPKLEIGGKEQLTQRQRAVSARFNADHGIAGAADMRLEIGASLRPSDCCIDAVGPDVFH
jgi:hypothetical protein